MSKNVKDNIVCLTILLVVSFIVTAFPVSYATTHSEITVKTAWDMMTNGMYPNLAILDVRNQSEFDAGYIPKAKLIPLWQLQQKIGELTSYKSTDIIVYCGTGSRSHDASLLLDAGNFAKVYDITGGFSAWNNSRYPISKVSANYVETAGVFGGAHFAIRIPPKLNGMLAIVGRGYSHTFVSDARGAYYNTATTTTLLSQGYAVAASAYSAGGYCIKTAINDTLQLTKFLKSFFNVTGKVFLIGYAMGGTVSLLLGEKYPDIYSGVIHVSGTTNSSATYVEKARWANLSDAALTAELNALTAPVPPSSFTNLDGLRTWCSNICNDMIIEFGGTPANSLNAYNDFSPLYHMNFTIPVITLHGTSDALVPVSQSLAFKDMVTKAGGSSFYRLYTVLGAQHAAPVLGQQVPYRISELIHMINDSHPVSLDVSAFTDVTVIPGWTWWFFVQNVGGKAPYSYQWYEGLNPMTGQTSMVLPMTKNAPGVYSFYCRVTDKYGTTTTSNGVTLTVLG